MSLCLHVSSEMYYKMFYNVAFSKYTANYNRQFGSTLNGSFEFVCVNNGSNSFVIADCHTLFRPHYRCAKSHELPCCYIEVKPLTRIEHSVRLYNIFLKFNHATVSK